MTGKAEKSNGDGDGDGDDNEEEEEEAIEAKLFVFLLSGLRSLLLLQPFEFTGDWRVIVEGEEERGFYMLTRWSDFVFGNLAKR